MTPRRSWWPWKTCPKTQINETSKSLRSLRATRSAGTSIRLYTRVSKNHQVSKNNKYRNHQSNIKISKIIKIQISKNHDIHVRYHQSNIKISKIIKIHIRNHETIKVISKYRIRGPGQGPRSAYNITFRHNLTSYFQHFPPWPRARRARVDVWAVRRRWKMLEVRSKLTSYLK